MQKQKHQLKQIQTFFIFIRFHSFHLLAQEAQVLP